MNNSTTSLHRSWRHLVLVPRLLNGIHENIKSLKPPIWANLGCSWMILNLFLAVPYLLRNHWILHGAPYTIHPILDTYHFHVEIWVPVAIAIPCAHLLGKSLVNPPFFEANPMYSRASLLSCTDGANPPCRLKLHKLPSGNLT